ncbi:MAG: HlyD family secretion protein [Roseateles asaccharophilus]|uniref:HlyD family secretion protein n=1 Tax=Roseateles asaccharophilus TaxID=582607 RepID=A0A4R6NBH2_9BURK|nr:efflux RND transporter periplasmic adaptor subunit [Roseateles asaccharophilus]MDN3546646.1 efflux RND transporter periplasmic adaptor subunit [Roseateles asaccharophilus]TDP12870.1 HlyD family secretion protein [Roseateles asaccharophilus]
MNAKKALIPAAVLLLAALGVYALWNAGHGPAQAPLQGMMEAQETDIAPKLTGRIAEVVVQEGQTIAAGALLLRIDSPEVQAKLAQASNAEAAASAVALKARNGARPQEIRIAQASYERARAGADLARKSFERVDSLFKDGLIAAQKRDEAETNWRASERQAEAAKAQWDMALAGARAEDQLAAAAQARQVAGLVQEVEAARAETQLKSPVAGEVAKVLAKVGELSPAGVPVVTVVDLQNQWALFNVREDQLARYAVGQEFSARLPALPALGPQRFKVVASQVLPDFATWRATRGNQGYDLRTFEVKARPLQPVAGARPGMSVIVE